MELAGLEPTTSWVLVPVASPDDVHAFKRAADRPKDRAYVEAAERS
jgi:hypothetical protein